MVIIERIKVLIVDDIEMIVKTIHLFLSENNNLEFIYAFDGLDAYRKIEESKPDIVIINYKMPKMTGVEVIEKVYNNISIKSPYFLLTTGDVGFSFSMKYANNTNIDLLYKPFTQNNLLEILSKHFDFINVTN